MFLEIADLCFKCFDSVCNLTDNIGILTSSVNDISEIMSRDVGICFLLGIDVFYFFIKSGGHSEEILLGRQDVLHMKFFYGSFFFFKEVSGCFSVEVEEEINVNGFSYFCFMSQLL